MYRECAQDGFPTVKYMATGNVSVSTFIEKISPRVIRKLLKWMAEEELIDRDTMEDYLPEGEREQW